MRAAIVVRRFSDRGGIESNVLALARHLVAKKHHVQIVCQRVEGEAARVDAEVVHVGAPGVLGETARLFWFARNAAREVARLDPDVSYTASHAHGVSVARLEGGLVADHREAVGGGLPELAVARIERTKIEGARCVLALSDRDARRTREIYGAAPRAVRVVRNGIDVARFDKTARPANATHTVGFIGNGFHRKNLSTLIEAKPEKLIVAGSDRRTNEYEARARTKGIDATFLGRIADVRELLAKIDVLAMPSLYEPFGLVALEAWASGVPVVLSAIAGASEIAPHAELIVSDPRDPQAIAAALERSKHVDRARCREVARAYPIEASLEAIETTLEEARRRR